MPAGSADLTFEYPKLVTESEDLSAEPGVWPAADDQELQQDSDDGVGEGEEHDGEDRRGRPGNVDGPAPARPNELTQVRLTGQVPYDRIIVTATPPFIPAAWRDQLRPGGLLVVPVQLGHDHAVAHLVVTFRRAGDKLISTAIVPGGFMGFRGPDGRRPDYPQARLGWYDSAGRKHAGGGLYGPGLARLGPAARRRLLGALVAGPRRTGLGRGADAGLFLYLVCTAPPRRLITKLAADRCLGLVDDRSGLAVLRYRWTEVERIGVVGAEHYGDSGAAERDLRRVVHEWRALGQPKLADFEVRVAFGRPPRGATWRLPSGGEARIGVSVRRPSGPRSASPRRWQ